jgi:hypothetical protein
LAHYDVCSLPVWVANLGNLGINRTMSHLPRVFRIMLPSLGLPWDDATTDDEGMAATASIGIPLNGFHVSAGR